MDVHPPDKFAVEELSVEMVGLLMNVGPGGGLWIMPLCGFVDRRGRAESRALPSPGGFGTAILVALA